MNRIYLVSVDHHPTRFPIEEAQHDADRCRKALEKEFPGSRFDSETVEGVVGVRYHYHGQYDLDHPTVKEKRDFARGFMASASLWER